VGLLDGKKAIVLGASSGIGWRTSERFAEEGADLIVAARREDRLEKLANKIGGVAIRCDVSDDSQVKALADAALERWGRIDVAVFLGSDMSSSITGHVIPVDGGNNLCRLPRWEPPRRRKTRTTSLE
jgi:enoyl-[acyl-carrier-protein] reductase (NADH)